MIADERMMTFIHSFDSGNPPYLYELEKYARETNVPIVRPQMQSLLKFLLTWGRPMKILEVGTAIGFSALLMSEYAPQGCHITTIEKYEKRIPLAKENFKKAGKEDKITLLEGDAVEILADMQETFDFIFMDPPYGKDYEYDVLLALSHSDIVDRYTIIVIEEALNVPLDYIDECGFETVKIKNYKTNKHIFIRLKESE